MVTESEMLQSLLIFSAKNDSFEESAQEFLEENEIDYVSHSRQYLVTRAFNHGWRP